MYVCTYLKTTELSTAYIKKEAIARAWLAPRSFCDLSAVFCRLRADVGKRGMCREALQRAASTFSFGMITKFEFKFRAEKKLSIRN